MSQSQPENVAPETPPGFRILIVEDEEWDAELAQRLLKNGDLQFTAAVVATQAEFSEHLDVFRPDVILSDFSLPGFSGQEALKIAQQRCPHIPFLIWSGVLGDDVAVELIKKGATDYILKDRPARLASAVEHALAAARDRAQLAELEYQLGAAQRLASQGQLADAARAVQQTRAMLAAARDRLTSTDGVA
jgi:DNA-binding NtrC family response regulator